jgi:hypothetical protein
VFVAERIKVPEPVFDQAAVAGKFARERDVIARPVSNVTEPLRFVRFMFNDDDQLASAPTVPPPRLMA